MVAAVRDGGMTTVAEGLRRFLAGYPGLKAGERVTTDLTEERAGSLALSPTGEERTREDVTGNREVTQRFWVCRSCLAADEADRRENREFLEGLGAWLLEKDRREELPGLPEGCRAERLWAGGARIMESSGGRGRSYRLELELTYTKKRRE